MSGWLFVVVVLLALTSTSADARTINFGWNASSAPNVAGYRLLSGTQPGVYTQTLDVGNVLTGQLNLADGQTFYLAVKAYDTAGVTSVPSNEIFTVLSIANPGNQVSGEGDAVSLQLIGSTLAGRVLAFSTTGLPSPLSVNPTTGVISGSLQTTTPGVYNVTATATDGVGAPAIVSFSWTVTTPVINPPGAFSKSSPANGATGQATSVTLSWGASSNATNYQYCYDTTNDNACSAWTSAGTAVSAGLSGLSTGTTYYWQVRATNTGGTTYANASSTSYRSFTTQGAVPGAFSMTSPANGVTGQATSVTLNWGASSNATSYQYCYDTTNDNACTTWTSTGSAVSVGLSGLNTGTTYYWLVRATNTAGTTYANGSSTAYRNFATQTAVPAQMTVPAPASTLTSSTVTFQWTGGTGVTGYYLQVGTTSGGADLYDQDRGTNLNATVSGLPTDGRALYVRLYSRINGNWQSTIYPYTAMTAAATSAKAEMTVPAPASTLTSSTVTFQWTGGTGVTQYYLQIGTTSGGADLFDQDRGTSLTATVSGLPTDGRAIYARLYSRINGDWQSTVYPYTAMTAVATSAKAEMTVPAPASTLAGSTVTFQWTGGTGVTQYYLQVGTTSGGADLFDQDRGTSLTATVSGLPTDGRLIYARLYSRINGDWQSTIYAYTTGTTGGTGTPASAQMSVPAPGSTLTSSTVTFQWTGGTGVTQYYLQVGTTSGGADLFDQDRGTSLTATVSGLPTDGRVIYARLYSRINGNWMSTIYPYTTGTTGGTGNPAPAQMTVPAPVSTLTSSTVTFQWTGGTGVTQYYLQVGTTSGGADLFDQDRGTSLTATVSGLPTDGRAIYARLYSRINGNWQSTIYPYTAVTTGGAPAPAQMSVPAPASTLTSSTVTFRWTGGTGVTQYYLQVGTTMGGGDLYDHDQAMALTATVSGLPTDGRAVHVRLWSMINGNWQSTFYTYTAATQ